MDVLQEETKKFGGQRTSLGRKRQPQGERQEIGRRQSQFVAPAGFSLLFGSHFLLNSVSKATVNRMILTK